ncbi:fimbrial chaperone [Lysobacter sp. S4-A87]|uniref:fimbrial chaperone n=1 Tax=Lysobacter sp. S4-A87 TaxID=2925843 RepID=UPI001F5300F2|nr:fimbrial chaperone [Lysobacter sp. S4-A87]UNK48144.1 fimbrial chaperone [Lysobacter sp. S4-A87]
MKKDFKALTATCLLAVGGMCASNADASVVIAGTRVVYPAQEREVTVKLTNDGKTPALTQIWLDRGDPDAAPSTIDVPFTVTPPVARIDPGKGQAVRIIYTGEALPQDKESVFWFNLLEVPPKPGADALEANVLQMAFRTRIKLFFRPSSLKAAGAADAPAQIRWSLVKDAGRDAIQMHNPTPYFVSFASVDVTGGGRTARFTDGGMVAPGETRAFALQGEVPMASAAKVTYHAINDYGGPIDGEAGLISQSAPKGNSP